MTLEPFILVGAVLAVMGAGALISRARQRKRREAYAEFSLIRGFKYEPQTPNGERRFRDAFEPFQKGDSESWRNTITGTKNKAPFTAFEYVWRTGKTVSFRTGVIWESDDVSFPRFELTPEGWLTRLGEVFGVKDFDFTDSAEFSKAYRLEGVDEASVRSLFTPEIRQFFATTFGQHVTGGGRFLIWWFASLLPPPSTLDEWLEQGDHVRRRFFKS